MGQKSIIYGYTRHIRCVFVAPIKRIPLRSTFVCNCCYIRKLPCAVLSSPCLQPGLRDRCATRRSSGRHQAAAAGSTHVAVSAAGACLGADNQQSTHLPSECAEKEGQVATTGSHPSCGHHWRMQSPLVVKALRDELDGSLLSEVYTQAHFFYCCMQHPGAIGTEVWMLHPSMLLQVLPCLLVRCSEVLIKWTAWNC